jgi:hypothetical protein
MDITNIILITSASTALILTAVYAIVRLIKAKKEAKGSPRRVPLRLKLICKRIARRNHGTYSEAFQGGGRITPVIFIDDMAFVFNWTLDRGEIVIPNDIHDPWIVNGKQKPNPCGQAIESHDVVARQIGDETGYRVRDFIYAPFLRDGHVRIYQTFNGLSNYFAKEKEFELFLLEMKAAYKDELEYELAEARGEFDQPSAPKQSNA